MTTQTAGAAAVPDRVVSVEPPPVRDSQSAAALVPHQHDLVMAETEHRRPDGKRELVVRDPTSALLTPNVAETPLACHSARHTELLGNEVPARCQVVISPGYWYLEHIMTGLGAKITGGQIFAYCAPCAVHEYSHWGVSETSE